MERDTIIFFGLALLLLYLVISLLKFLQNALWEPHRITKTMAAQGITGPPYKFFYGNTKEVVNMPKESTARSMELSHDILPHVQPHLHEPAYLVWHEAPDLIKEILTNKHGAFPKTPTSVYVRKLLGDGLVTVEGEKWARQRKLANHAFHVYMLKSMIPVMVASVEAMLDKWQNHEGKTINLAEEFRVLTSDIISRTAFGSSYIEGKHIFIMLQELGMIVARNAQTVRFPILGKYIRNRDDIESDRAEKCVRESIIQLVKIREEKKVMGDLQGYGSDFLGLLVAANHEGDKYSRISTDDIINECKTFHTAGHETTSTALLWTALLLAINTDWQEKARKEVIELFGNRTPNPDDNIINKLKTMNMIINESLRLYPPVLLILRKLKHEARMGNLVLPTGIEVAVSPLAVHHDPNIWGDNVQLFKPERFAEGVVKASKNSMAFLPFGMGSRICVGQNFAMVEVKVVFSMILQRYAFSISPTYIHSPMQGLTMFPQHGLQIVLHKL